MLHRPDLVETAVRAIKAVALPVPLAEEWEVLTAVAGSLGNQQDLSAEIYLLRHLATRKY
ncbi:MAG: hypothetical protein K2X03_01725 [Bryobacteraceae bacterium]|nr:hypothetical protein [Bryobacteraceae bacterium]